MSAYFGKFFGHTMDGTPQVEMEMVAWMSMLITEVMMSPGLFNANVSRLIGK